MNEFLLNGEARIADVKETTKRATRIMQASGICDFHDVSNGYRIDIIRDKPLKVKAYGHIPHLPGSRKLNSDDIDANDGQYRICTQPNDRGYRVIVQEKLDGSCVAVANIDGEIVPLVKDGFHAATSPYEQHYHFARWVKDRHREKFLKILRPGERIVGEWLLQAHGTRYKITNPGELFAPFDIFDPNNQRISFDEFLLRAILHFKIPMPIGKLYMTPGEAMRALEPRGFHHAEEQPEGAVWRVEQDNKVLFLAKYVRPDKEDGKYLPEVTGGEPVWNFDSERI